jgi:hypothetical protein
MGWRDISASRVCALNAGESNGLVKMVEAANPEKFVSQDVVSEFLSLRVREVLELARRRVIRGYPIGNLRNRWRFRLSEVADDITALGTPTTGRISAAAPASRRRKSNGEQGN